MKRILFATSELYPLVKTGGLADVAWSLPRALQALGHDVVIAVPGYRAIKHRVKPYLSSRRISGFGLHPDLHLHTARLPGTELLLWVIDCPALFDRDGGPYEDAERQPWPDNPYRFAQFCRALVEIVCYDPTTDWHPQVVHSNDWQTGLIPALLSLAPNPPASVFTLHNLAYQGVYDRQVFDALALPPQWWHLGGVEFHGRWSFLKAGIVFADAITTVSPSYAREILTPEQGYGMDGILRQHRAKLVGILNGVDYDVWNPASDAYLEHRYDSDAMDGKQLNKIALQQRFGLAPEPAKPLAVMVSRLVFQKGVDLVIATLRKLAGEGCLQWLIVGMGDAEHERALRQLADAYPHEVAVYIGYDESLAHQVEAGGDLFLMPSRYEPCGLNQIYSLRYGTVPIVKATGGLRDTVVDAQPQTLADGTATGFSFAEHSPDALLATLQRALASYADHAQWQQLQQQGMRCRFSWQGSAADYSRLYDQCLSGL